MKNWLYNKIVLITGASSGIGKEIMKLLINKYNCFVLGVARNKERLKDIKKDFKDNFEYITGDVSVEEDWKKIFEFAKQFECDILINNAGTMPPFMSFDKIGYDNIEKIFRTNYYSIVYSSRLFLDYLFKNNGAIINITSSSAIGSIPGQSIYSASKSAAVAYSKIISTELNKKIFVATYLPGFTKTNLFSSKDNIKPIFDKRSAKFIDKFCMKPEKMAQKIVRSMAHKKKYKIFGKDAKLMKFLNEVAPVKSSILYYKIFRKTHFDCFEEIFN